MFRRPSECSLQTLPKSQHHLNESPDPNYDFLSLSFCPLRIVQFRTVNRRHDVLYSQTDNYCPLGAISHRISDKTLATVTGFDTTLLTLTYFRSYSAPYNSLYIIHLPAFEPSLPMAHSKMSSPIVLLPTEIHILVLKELDQESLLKVRLTCKPLNYHATPPAFKRLHVWLEEESLQKLVNIANKPHLRKHVKFIDFGMDFFYDVSGAYFKQKVFPKVSVQYALGQKKPEVALLNLAWYKYRNYYLNQLTLKNTNRDLAMFTHAIAAFSALKCIRLVDFQSHVEGSNQGPKLLKKEILLRRDILNTASFRAPRPPIPLGSHQLRILIRALAASGDSKIESLCLQLYTANSNKQGFYSTLSATDADFAKSAFSGLKRLTLSLAPVHSSVVEEWRRTSTESSVTTVLKAATELEDLRLEFPLTEGSSTAMPGARWKDIIQTTRFGKLKTLSIKGGILNENHFVSFLTQSCQGLNKLELSFAIVVEGGSWDLVFKTIRRLPKLTDLALEALWCGTYPGGFIALDGSNMKRELLYDYLLKRTDDNPWQAMCRARRARVAKQYRELTERDLLRWWVARNDLKVF